MKKQFAALGILFVVQFVFISLLLYIMKVDVKVDTNKSTDSTLATDTPKANPQVYGISDEFGTASAMDFNFTEIPPDPIQTGSFDYEFSVTSDTSTITALWFEINGGGSNGIDPVDGVFDEPTEEFTLHLESQYLPKGETSTISFHVRDAEDPAIQVDENVEFNIDGIGPTVAFDEVHDGLVGSNFTFSGSLTDEDTGVWQLRIRVGSWGGDYYRTAYDDGSVSQTTADWEYTFHAYDQYDNFAEGSQTIYFTAVDGLGNQHEYTHTVDVDKGIPTCTASWTNQAFRVYSNAATYPSFNCTDNRNIVSAKYDLYHAGWGTLISPTDISPIDGVFGDETTESFTFTATIDPDGDLDGPVSVGFHVKDAAGNESSDEDPFVIEYNDNSDPIVKIDAITPDPITDKTPQLSGSCGDITEFDTNTNISSLEYRMDAGSWTPLDPLTPPLNDSKSEEFSMELPELANGSHTVEVKCIDGATHEDIASDTFTVADIDETAQPGEFSHSDTFEDHDNQDLANSSLIWGNGQLRLKEDITFDRQAIDTTIKGPRYGDYRTGSNIIKDPLDSNILWYTGSDKLIKYNINTTSKTQLDTDAIFGIDNFIEIKNIVISIYQGKEYLWIGDFYNFYVYNITDNVGIVKSDLSSGGGVLPDTSRGRFGAYLINLENTPGGSTNLSYWDLNDTFINQADDTTERAPIDGGGFAEASAQVIISSNQNDNIFYTGFYNHGIYKFDDKNTPTDFSDDDISLYVALNVFGMTTDPDGKLIFGTSNNSNGRVYVVTNLAGTPVNTSDDTVIQIASPLDLGYLNVGGIQYIQGENNVGDQLMIGSQGGNPVYMNFNDTYEDLFDDTFIYLDISAGVRPNWVNPMMYDYNTIYANIDRQGLFKVNLHRGWEDSGEAIGVPSRPSNKLILNNFLAEASEGGPIAFIPSSSNSISNLLAPSVEAAGSVNYYISNDDGVTWLPIALGELKQINPADYKVKFKIEMTENGGASPVLDSYTLDFAGYTTPSQSQDVDSLSATASPTSVNSNTNFNLVIYAQDPLGFPVAGNSDVVNMALLDTSTNSIVTGLSQSSTTLTDGATALTNLQIDHPGTFKIRVTDGALTADSNMITIGNTSTSSVPAISFYADKYTIAPGESITLTWSSSFVNNLTITPDVGAVESSGTLTITPDATTTYTLSGSTGSNTLSSSITITVGELQPVSAPVGNGIIITTIADQNVSFGDKVEFSWEVTNASYVFIDYVGHEVSSEGKFDFIATENTEITITATKGEESAKKTVKITVFNLPFSLDQLGVFGPIAKALLQLPAVGLVFVGIINILTFLGLLLNILNSGAYRLTLESIENILRVLGVIPFKKRRGYVYQTKVIKGVPFATININSKDENKILSTIVTDLEGTYYEPFIARGNYSLEVKHNESQFPTGLNRPMQLSVYDFYKGETLAIGTEKEKQAIVIPMDNESSIEDKADLKTKFMIFSNRLLVWLKWTLYPMFGLSIATALISPNLLNIIIAAIYSILMLFRIIEALKPATFKLKLTDRESGEAVKGAFVQVKNDLRELVAIGKTNSRGVAKFYVPKKTYSITINAENYISEGAFAEMKSVDLNMESDYEYYMNKVQN